MYLDLTFAKLEIPSKFLTCTYTENRSLHYPTVNNLAIQKLYLPIFQHMPLSSACNLQHAESYTLCPPVQTVQSCLHIVLSHCTLPTVSQNQSETPRRWERPSSPLSWPLLPLSPPSSSGSTTRDPTWWRFTNPRKWLKKTPSSASSRAAHWLKVGVPPFSSLACSASHSITSVVRSWRMPPPPPPPHPCLPRTPPPPGPSRWRHTPSSLCLRSTLATWAVREQSATIRWTSRCLLQLLDRLVLYQDIRLEQSWPRPLPNRNVTGDSQC